MIIRVSVDHNLRTYDMTPGFKPFTAIIIDTKNSTPIQCWSDPCHNQFKWSYSLHAWQMNNLPFRQPYTSALKQGMLWLWVRGWKRT